MRQDRAVRVLTRHWEIPSRPESRSLTAMNGGLGQEAHDLCADDVLRQELCDKMSKCQYAVPFLQISNISERKISETKYD